MQLLFVIVVVVVFLYFFGKSKSQTVEEYKENHHEKDNSPLSHSIVEENVDLPQSKTNEVASDFQLTITIDGTVFKFRPADIILLHWVDGVAVESVRFPHYFSDRYNINPLKTVDQLIERGFITIAGPADSLNSLKVTQLKDILKDNSQKISGVKKDLIERIRNNIPVQNYRHLVSDTFKISDDAKDIVDRLKLILWVHKEKTGTFVFSDIASYIDTDRDIEDISLELYEKKTYELLTNGSVAGATMTSRQCANAYTLKEDYHSALNYYLISLLLQVSGLHNTNNSEYYFVSPTNPYYIRISDIINTQLKLNYSDLAVTEAAKATFDLMAPYLRQPMNISSSKQFSNLIGLLLKNDMDSAVALLRKAYNKIPERNRFQHYDDYFTEINPY